jgi:hypothetical protein
MLKEIFEQPNAIRETIGSHLPENELCNFENLNFSKQFLDTINKITKYEIKEINYKIKDIY